MADKFVAGVYKKPKSVEEIGQKLLDLGFPNEFYLARTDHEWPIHAVVSEAHVLSYLRSTHDHGYKRHAVKVDVARGLVTEVELVVQREHLIEKKG